MGAIQQALLAGKGKTYWSSVTDSVWHTNIAWFSTTVKQGMCFSTTKALRVVSCIKHTNTTATTCYIISGNWYWWSVLATVSYSWTTATFNYDLSAWTYTICNDSWWSTYTNRYWAPSPAYTQAKTNITYVSAWGSNTSQWLDIESITTQVIT